MLDEPNDQSLQMQHSTHSPAGAFMGVSLFLHDTRRVTLLFCRRMQTLPGKRIEAEIQQDVASQELHIIATGMFDGRGVHSCLRCKGYGDLWNPCTTCMEKRVENGALGSVSSTLFNAVPSTRLAALTLFLIADYRF